MEISKVERELLNVTGFKAKDNMSRAKYLEELLQEAHEAYNDDAKSAELSEDTKKWIASSVERYNAEKPLKDFDGKIPSEVSASEEEDPESDTGDPDDNDETGEGNPEPEEDDDMAVAEVATAQPKNAPKTVKKAAVAKSNGNGNGGHKATAKPAKVAKTAPVKAVAKPAAKPAKAAAPAKAATPAKTKAPAKKGGELDRFGVKVGTQTATAVKMLSSAKGAKMADVRAATGVNHYNLLKRLEAEGHSVVHGDNKVIKLTHKDDAK